MQLQQFLVTLTLPRILRCKYRSSDVIVLLIKPLCSPPVTNASQCLRRTSRKCTASASSGSTRRTLMD